MKQITIIALVGIVCILIGCGKLKAAGGVSIMTIRAPNGANCYVIMQGDEARGGNCE